MSRSSRDLCLYFDSCIYIARYRQEIQAYGKPRIDAIEEVWSQNEKGAYSIITSSLTICEVMDRLLQLNLKAEIEDFKNRFKAGYHTLIDVDPVISEKAAEYRQHYRMNPVTMAHRPAKPFINLATPDAIHLATAKLYDCDEFWTFDGLAQSTDKHESIKPLWLNNKIGNDVMIITAPALAQGTLPLK